MNRTKVYKEEQTRRLIYRSQRSEVRGQMSEVRCQKSDKSLILINLSSVLCLLSSLFLMIASPSLAMQMNEYREKVDGLILSLREERWDEADILSMELASPRVDVGGEVIEVDNGWLLKESELNEKRERLKSISSHLARFGLRGPGTEAEEIDPKQMITEILLSKEYQSPPKMDKGFHTLFSSIGKSIGDFIDKVVSWFYKLQERRELPAWFVRFIEWCKQISDAISDSLEGLFRWLFGIFGLELSEKNWSYIFSIAICLMVLLAGAFILKRVRDSRSIVREEEFQIDDLTKEVAKDPKELLSSGLRFERDGNYLEAIRGLYLAILSYLNRRGIIRFSPSKTNGEYLRELVDKIEFHHAFRSYTLLFETKYYGHQVTTQNDFRYCYNLAREIMGIEG